MTGKIVTMRKADAGETAGIMELARSSQETIRVNEFWIAKIPGGGKSRIREGKTNSGIYFVFSPEEFNLSYKLDGKSYSMKVSAAGLPGGAECSIDHTSAVYVSGISEGSAKEVKIRAPVGFTHENITNNLKHGKPNKLVVPSKMNNEVLLEEGSVAGGTGNYLFIGPENQEFSAGNSSSPQDFHLHKYTMEAFVTFSGMTLVYAGENGQLNETRAKPGDIIIVPSGVAHYSIMSGLEPTYVMKASSNPIKTDKYIVNASEYAISGVEDDTRDALNGILRRGNNT